MFEFDLGIEDGVVGDRIGRQQHELGGTEAVLPVAMSRGVLHRAVFYLAIGTDTETDDGRGRQSENGKIRGGSRRTKRLPGRFGAEIGCIGGAGRRIGILAGVLIATLGGVLVGILNWILIGI